MRIMWLFTATLFGVVAVMINGDEYTRCYPGLCQQLCFDTINGYQCRCNAGFYINPSNIKTCIPVVPPGCPVPNPCEQLCIPQGSSYRCGCRHGFYIDPKNGIKCIAMNPYTCAPGYIADPSSPNGCKDIDECLTQNTCQHKCENLQGSYRCTCHSGYVVSGADNTKCTAIYPNKCGPGYIADPSSPNGCKDIDECLTQNTCQHKCDNLQGSYRCTCHSGYVVSGADNTKCTGIQQCNAPVDVYLVWESTDAIGSSNYQLLLSFVSEIPRHFQIGPKKARFGAATFSDAVHLLFELDDYKTSDRISSEILASPYLRGNTVNFEVFDYIRKKDLFHKASGGRVHVTDLVILITAGRSENDLSRAAAENLKNTGVKIIVIGIGDGVSPRELTSIASTRGHLLLVPDFYHIENIQEKLIELICPDYDD